MTKPITTMFTMCLPTTTAEVLPIGRTCKSGEPHYGSHAWPGMNSAILSIVDETRLGIVMKALHTLDEAKPALGLRAFVWDIEKMI